jgi:hypothetical protein
VACGWGCGGWLWAVLPLPAHPARNIAANRNKKRCTGCLALNAPNLTILVWQSQGYDFYISAQSGIARYTLEIAILASLLMD